MADDVDRCTSTLTSPRELTSLAAAVGGLPVLFCNPGSPADLAGVCYGDIVLTVNGMKTPHWDAFVEARAKNSLGMTLEVFRAGATVTIEMSFAPQEPPAAAPDKLAHLLALHVAPKRHTN